jgi:hypothetical protein
MKKLSIVILSLLITALIIQGAILQKNVTAVTQTKVKVEPANNIFYTNTTTVGTTFKISIIAENIPNQEGGMAGWELILSWTPGLINCTAQQLNYAYWPSNSGPLVASPIDNVLGTYHQALSSRTPSNPVTGTYWLVNITFKITRAPPEGGSLSTNMTLQPAPGLAYLLIDIYGNEIHHEFINGFYKYISPRPPLPEITLKVTPPAIFNPALVPCTTFDINVTIINALYLHSFSLKLSYNGTTIECTSVQEGDLLKKFGATTMSYQINNTAEYTFVSINLNDPMATANGNGTLVTLSFHVLNIGDSELHLYETQLYDAEGNSLSHKTSDGYFNNVLMPRLFVYPPVIVDPTMKPGSTFEININVANVSDLYDFEFKLTYDTKVLNVLGILVYPFNNAVSYDLQFTLNDTSGKIWVRMQYYPPAEPLTTVDSVTLVKVFFQVQSYGATPLHLEGTELSDHYGSLITHITGDGYVSVLRRDVAIIDVVPQFTEVYKGWKVNITAVAKNLGDIPETFNVTAFFGGNEIGTQQVTSLAPNDTILLLFNFNTLQPWIIPCHNYTLSAEASIVPYEINVTNNVLTDGQIHVKMMGDVNGDGYVNIKDAALVGAAFGSKAGDPSPPWDPKCDLNQDGYINIKDVVLLGINFGGSCP